MSFISDFDLTAPISPLQAASRFNSYFDAHGLSLNRHSDSQQRTITLIARSPASPPAQALAMNLDRFQPLSIEVNIIFAQIAPAEALNFMLRALSGACSGEPETLIRWARNRALLDAHERLTLGRTLCWTGDSMRRSEDSRSAIDRVDDATPSMLAEAGASFAALWRASKPLPRMVYSRGGLLNVERGAPVPSPMAPNMAGEPNIVRLDDYVRSRRH